MEYWCAERTLRKKARSGTFYAPEPKHSDFLIMPNYRRVYIGGGCYFFTVVSYRRQQILCHENVRTALRDGVRATHPFTIDAWVLLPDHLHCIWTLPEEDSDFGKRWGMIKRYVTKRCSPAFHQDKWMTGSKHRRNESTLWQRRFWEHLIRDEQDYETHMNYIHYNPVKHGLATKVSNWEYSTFHRYVHDGIYNVNWGDHVDIPSDISFGE